MTGTTELHRRPPPAPASLAARIAATFLSPAALARSIRERPRWIDALLISTAVAVLAAATLPAEFFLTAAEDAVTRRGTPVEITSSPAEIARWGRYLAMLNALIGHPLIAFGLAGLLTLIFTILAGGRATFAEHLALTSHALLILALGTLTTILARVLLADPTAELSLALLIPGPRTGWLGEMLGLVNPFTVWMLIAVAVGVSVLDPGRSRRSSLAVLLGAYLTLVIVLTAAV